MDKDSCHWNELEEQANNIRGTKKFIQEKWTVIPSSNTEGTTQTATCPLPPQLRLLRGSQRSVLKKEKCSWITCRWRSWYIQTPNKVQCCWRLPIKGTFLGKPFQHFKMKYIHWRKSRKKTLIMQFYAM